MAPEGTSARLVLLSFRQMKVDITFLDQVAIDLYIDPLFLWRHFDEVLKADQTQPIGDWEGVDRPPFIRRSDRQSVHIGFRDAEHVSVIECSPEDKSGYSGPSTGQSTATGNRPHQKLISALALILLTESAGTPIPGGQTHALMSERPSVKNGVSADAQVGRADTMHDQLKELLLKLTSDRRRQISENPLTVIVPLLYLYITKSEHRVERALSGLDLLIERFLDDQNSLSKIHPEMQHLSVAFVKHSRSLSNSLRSMKAGRALLTDHAARKKLNKLTRDLKDVLDLTNNGQKQLENLIAAYRNNVPVRLPRRSVYAKIEKKVTKMKPMLLRLLFVIILIAFLSLQTLGSQNLPVGLVIKVAAAVFVLMLPLRMS